ncbi:MAG: N-acetylmuramoyl-L-alanine amidase [Acaryochloridaceae cyanobacterium CSU_5_19]|nr:N-acetylmuramoyl-L-alanine amidase [Acaryochloridaceae cyanobacterium CSU_5_19]
MLCPPRQHRAPNLFTPDIPLEDPALEISQPPISLTPAPSQSTLSAPAQNQPLSTAPTGWQPRETKVNIHPSNYGERFAQDVKGQRVQNDWLLVLHETAGSASSAINHFQTPHPKEEDQSSYHALILLDGTIVYLLPPEKRAFGAGNSVFVGPQGPETVQTKATLPPSVNNFAYHISLETPIDGRNNNNPSHSGYSELQYQSLNWLIGRIGIPLSRVTTHAAVDRSGSRSDPRSFDFSRLVGR